MSRIDPILKVIWLIIGLFAIAWLGLVRVPHEWQRWEASRERDRRPPHVQREPGVIVGEQATQDREQRVRRQGLRFSVVLDPALQSDKVEGQSRQFRGSDWLLVPVSLATFSRPQAMPAALRVHDPAADYSWKSGIIGDDYTNVRLQAVNIVFYTRDGSKDRLLLDQPAWIQGVLLPKNRSGRYFYEIAISDTNGDDRIDGEDGITLWSSEPDGTDLDMVWMPSGEVSPNRYREPASGDLFGTVVSDTDNDGEITEYDRHELFRIAIGDTVSRSVVSLDVIERIEGIIFGDGDHVSR